VNEEQVEQVFSELKRSSRVSVVMVVLGTLFLIASVSYSALRLRPLETKLTEKREELARVEQELGQRKQEYETLKASVEQLYSVRVTPSNEVYQVKATARATGKATTTTPPAPEYEFKIFINSAPDVLSNIEEVQYEFNHPTFKVHLFIARDKTDRFAMSYIGWGCLTSVGVKVILKDGTSHTFDFNMCRSLGPQWS
jgi:hypothetical protein